VSGSGGGVPASSWLARAWQAALVVLATAAVSRVAWELLMPLMPGLLVSVVLIGMVSFMLKGRL